MFDSLILLSLSACFREVNCRNLTFSKLNSETSLKWDQKCNKIFTCSWTILKIVEEWPSRKLIVWPAVQLRKEARFLIVECKIFIFHFDGVIVPSAGYDANTSPIQYHSKRFIECSFVKMSSVYAKRFERLSFRALIRKDLICHMLLQKKWLKGRKSSLRSGWSGTNNQKTLTFMNAGKQEWHRAQMAKWSWSCLRVSLICTWNSEKMPKTITLQSIEAASATPAKRNMTSSPWIGLPNILRPTQSKTSGTLLRASLLSRMI